MWGVETATSTPQASLNSPWFLGLLTLADRSVPVGRTLRDLALPVDAAAVAVVREGHVVVPKEDTVFAAGDEVLVVTSEASESRARELLVGEGQEEPDEGATEEPEPVERLQ